MRPFYLELAANSEILFPVKGNFFLLLDSNNALEVTLTGKDQERTSYMRQGDWIQSDPEMPFTFDSVKLVNTGGTTAAIRFEAGFGRMGRAVSQISETAPATSTLDVGTTITLQLSDAELVSGNNYKIEKTIAANSSRKKISFQVLDYLNTEALNRVGLGSGMTYDNTSGLNTAGNGLQLDYGTIYTLDHSGILTFAMPNKMDASGLITISYLEFS